MKNLLSILFLLISVFMYGQKVPVMKKFASGKEYKIDLYTAYQNRAPILQTAQFAEDIEFIPLETTDDCLLGDFLTNIVVTKENIIVFDYEGCYRFNRKGKFLNKIGKKGNGPGEYTNPMSIVVDTLNRWVYFSDDGFGRFVKYDYSGKYIANLKVDGMGATNTLYKPKEFILEQNFYQFNKKGERYSLFYYSEDQKKILSKMRCDYDKDIPKLMICDPTVYNYRGNTFIKDFWCDTIYQLTNPYKLVSHAIINRGHLGYRTQDDKSLITGKKDSEEQITLAVHTIVETDRFFFIGSNQGKVIYDKQLNKTVALDYDIPFMDDLYGSPGLIYYPSISNKNEIYQAIHAHKFLEGRKSKHSISDSRYNVYLKIIDNLTEDDNPVIMIVKVKK